MRIVSAFFSAVLSMGCASVSGRAPQPPRPSVIVETAAHERGRAIDLAVSDALRRKLPFAGVTAAEGYGSSWIITLGPDAGIAVVYLVSTRNDSIREVRFVPLPEPLLHARGSR